MTGRRDYLDGLRGIAALTVVAEHMSALLPVGQWRLSTGTGADLFASLLNFPFRAGPFAVYVFFAISGLVLAGSASRRASLPRAIVARYIRLVIPMLGASLLAWSCLRLFPHALADIGTFLPNHWTRTIYQDGALPLAAAFREPLIGTFIGEPTQLNPVLWSMRVEFWGSVGIYIFYALRLPLWRIRALALAAGVMCGLGLEQYLPFPFGAILYEALGRFPPRQNSFVALLAAIASLGCGVTANSALARQFGRALDINVVTLLNVIGAGFALLCLLMGWQARYFARTLAARFLGRISFSLYLTHMPLLYTAWAALYIWLGRPPSIWSLLTWGVTFFVAAMSLAYLSTIILDQPATRLSKLIGARAARPIEDRSPRAA